MDTSAITLTTTLTNTQPLALVQLPSGATGAIVYTYSVGDAVQSVLIALILVLLVIQMWRTRRTA